MIELLRTDGVDAKLLESLAPHLERTFGIRCRARVEAFRLPLEADAVRRQYYSTAILQHLNGTTRGKVLAVTEVDLFVPVLTFVFGEAQLPGSCAVVSTCRLDERFYGLPENDTLLRERLLKEAVHELGHTFGLLHCDNWQCAMTSSHAVERLDVKTAGFCAQCHAWLSGRFAGFARQQSTFWLSRAT